MSDIFKNKERTKYLRSVLLNHVASGFCILEFGLSSSSVPTNPTVVKSSGYNFTEAALEGLRDGLLEPVVHGPRSLDEKFRLSFYFKKTSSISA
tara:strand:+ start:523 stop:804 length:282 start_codon:yes stop_codon:yes gene_type:complete